MKGAITEPCASTKRLPTINITMMRGNNQSFFRIFKNNQSSLIKSIILFRFKIDI